MKLFHLLFIGLLLIAELELQAQDSVYLSQDYPTVRVFQIEKEGGVKNQFWYPWVGAVIGSFLGFVTAWIILGINNRRINRLREQDHYRDILKELYEAQTDLTPVFVKLRDIAYNLYFLNFSYNYDYCKAYQLEQDEEGQFEDLLKSNQESSERFIIKKELYDNIAADSTKYFMKFQIRMEGERRKEFKNLMIKLLGNDFYVYDYFNQVIEDEPPEHHSTYYPLKKEIFKKNIKEHFHQNISEQLQKFIMEEIRTILEKIDELGSK